MAEPLKKKLTVAIRYGGNVYSRHSEATPEELKETSKELFIEILKEIERDAEAPTKEHPEDV